MTTISDEQIKDEIDKFYESIGSQVDHRYKSWEYCHSAFYEKFRQTKLSDQDIELLALHLGFYLASWGMYRGSSFLLKHYDFTIHKECVCLAFEWKELMNIDPLTNKQRYLELLFDKEKGIYDKIYTHYQNKASTSNSNATMTLISKILLGIFGCMPAYDRYVDSASKILDIKKVKDKRPCVESIIDFANAHKAVFEHALKNIDPTGKKNYTLMKIIDMFLWQYGYDASQQ